MNYIGTIGMVAAFLTTISFLPQVIQVIKTQDTKSISLGMYSLFVTGVGLWIVYGVFKKDLPLILANTVTFVLAFIILKYKVKEVISNIKKKHRKD